MPSPLSCQTCLSHEVEEYADYSAMARVTSDCRVWKRGGTLRQCRACGTVQVDCNAGWFAEIQEIYGAYSIYSQAGGEEQKVFNPLTGQGMARSAWILEKLAETVAFPAAGRLLDIGCGNGQFIKSFGARFPAWRLTGSEFDGKYKALVEALPQVDLMHAGALDDLAETFDLISLIHVLEHIPDPLPFLAGVTRRMRPGGLLLVQLPYYLNNPFELLVADHSFHYTLPTAAQLLTMAGFEPVLLRDDLVPKELTLVMRLGEKAAPASWQSHFDAHLQAQLDWLKRCVSEMTVLQSEGGKVGIFGSAIAASWLAANLAQPPDFFLDEDPSRRGHRLEGVPILPPSEAPAGAKTLVPLGPPFAERVEARLGKTVSLHLVR